MITPLTTARLADFDALFSGDPSTHLCRCMWFIKPVKKYHEDGPDGNKAEFEALARDSTLPLGLLAYDDKTPVGWCATGPRSRYFRAIRTPTYAGRDEHEDDDVWLVPCMFVRPEARGGDLGRTLVAAAVELAAASGARAIEAFPYAGTKRRSSDVQVGFESVYSANGFVVLRRPSDHRLVMRRDIRTT